MKEINDIMKRSAMNSIGGIMSKDFMSKDFIIVEINDWGLDINPVLSRYMEQGQDRTGKKYFAKDGDWKCWYVQAAVLKELPRDQYPEFYI